jgi:PAS domain S-box-containing protein
MKSTSELLEKMERMARIGSWKLDFAKNKVTWSDEVYRIFGLTHQTFSHTNEGFMECVHPDDRAMVHEITNSALEKGLDRYEFDYRIVRKDNGEVRYVHEICEHVRDIDGNIIGSTGILQDVTERKELEINLRRSEERFQRLANDMPALVKEYLPDSTLTYVNQYYCTYFGMTEEELIGRRFLELVPKHMREKIEKAYRSLTPDKPFTVNSIHTYRDGELRWRQWRDRAFFDEKGEAIRYQAIGFDITEIKRAETALKDANKKLKAAIKKADDAVQAKSRFLASMSHEIRTPLNGLVGMLHLMQMTELTEEQKEIVIIAQTSSDILLNLINNILDYSKLGSGDNQLEKYSFDLEKLLEEIKRLFVPMAEMKGLTFGVQSDGKFPQKLTGDPVRLKQVLINLVGNALKFTKEGQIDLAVKVIERQQRQIKLEWKVQDTGIGIPQEHQQTIFDSFRQAGDSSNCQYGGTGLGLTICRSIVKHMQGEIWVESQKNKGSQFYFTTVFELPEEEIESKMNDETEQKRNHESKIHLLVVDDDRNSRLLIERIGINKGWQVTLAENSLEAMAAYRENYFDVVLMDMQLNLEKEAQATVKIRRMEEERGIHTPIIVVTAQALPGDREECLKAGADDYVAKPFKPEHLIEKIERWTKSNP